MIDACQLFPHKVYSELNLVVTDLVVRVPPGKSVSAKARPAVTVHPNEYELYADEALSGWTELSATLRVFAPEGALAALLPAGSDLATNTVMVVSVKCEATKLRRRVFLTLDADRPGEWYGQVDFKAGDISDVVEFSPLLARSTRLPDKAADEDGVPLATFRGAIIGFGDSVRLRADQPKERNGSFKVRWEDFSTSSHPWRRSHEREMFYIETAEDSPEVVLNAKHDLLKQTLMKKRPRGAEAGVKSAILAYVAHATWTSLFLAAISDCVRDGGEEDAAWPSDPTKQKALKRLLPLIIPERTDDEERLQLAVELFQDPSRVGVLLTKLHSAIQSAMKVDDFVISTLEATTEESAA